METRDTGTGNDNGHAVKLLHKAGSQKKPDTADGQQTGSRRAADGQHQKRKGPACREERLGRRGGGSIRPAREGRRRGIFRTGRCDGEFLVRNTRR
jgi:hypothetical protein